MNHIYSLLLLSSAAMFSFTSCSENKPVDEPASVTEASIELPSDLLYAIKYNDVKAVAQCLKQNGLNPNAMYHTASVDMFANGSSRSEPESRPRTLLHYAAMANSPDVIKYLLDTSLVDVNKSESEYDSPLSAAADRGHIECVMLLLAAPSIDVNRGLPLSAAAYNGHVEILKRMIGMPGVDVNKGIDAYASLNPPLEAAVKGGQSECLQILLAIPGIDVHANLDSLISAARYGHSECLKLLLTDKRFDINVTGGAGYTALHLAARDGHIECVKLLLESGADTTIVNRNGKTALSLAEEKGETEIVELLKASTAK